MADQELYTTCVIRFPPPAYRAESPRTPALELESLSVTAGVVPSPPRYAPPPYLPTIPEARDLEEGPPPYLRLQRIRWKWLRQGGWRERITPALLVALAWILVLGAILFPPLFLNLDKDSDAQEG
jgi:hypothetical protein